MQSTNKKIYFIKTLFLFFILFICINKITEIFRDKTNAELIYPFFSEKQNTIDVIFLGSSHMYRSIYPLDIWHEYGITSWNLGSSEQPIAASYHLAKIAIEEQHPKVIVMEMYMSFIDSKYYNYARIHQITDNLPLSLSKLEMIDDLIPKEDQLEFYFPISIYHSRWPQLSKKDFKKISSNRKGIGYSNTIYEYPDFEIVDSSQKYPLPDITIEYIKKTKALCDKYDVQLLLIAVPYLATGEYENRQKSLNSIYDIADELKVPYIDMFHNMDEIGLDRRYDFAEWQHLNINGAKKVSSYIGKYIKENYNIKDRRNDTELSQKWDEDYKTSLSEQENALQKN